MQSKNELTIAHIRYKFFFEISKSVVVARIYLYSERKKKNYLIHRHTKHNKGMLFMFM